MSDHIARAPLHIARAAIAAVSFATLAALLLIGAAPARAATLVVDATPSVVGNTIKSCTGTLNPYTTIQSAVTAALSGSTILVCPGTYPEQVTIATPLTLKGVTDTTNDAGAAVVTIPGGTFTGPPFPFTQILIQAADVTLTNIGIDGTNTNSIGGCFFGISLTGILFDTGSSGTLTQVALRNQYVSNGSGGYCGSGTAVYAASAASVAITDSSARNFDSAGIQLTATSSVTVKATTVAPLSPSPPLAATPNCVYANAPTVQVSSNAVANCGTGVYITSTVLGTVAGNTIAGGSNSVNGIYCFPICTGLTVSGNQIFNTQFGYGMKTSGGTGGVVIKDNDISGTNYGVYLFLQPGNTVSNNTINDAAFGVYSVTGNSLSGNTYRTVTTLTTP